MRVNHSIGKLFITWEVSFQYMGEDTDGPKYLVIQARIAEMLYSSSTEIIKHDLNSDSF